MHRYMSAAHRDPRVRTRPANGSLLSQKGAQRGAESIHSGMDPYPYMVVEKRLLFLIKGLGSEDMVPD